MVKSTIVFFLFLSWSLHISAQGMKFEQGLSWEQVKAKAKAGHKYIFVDCFATWCRPCEEMDKEVYAKDSVAKLLDKDFISVKVQCDTSKNDGEVTRLWYKDAHELSTAFKINAYPTYLFFSSDGKVVHKATGYLSSSQFLSLTNEALDPKKQYYTLLDKYHEGSLPYSEFPSLTKMTTNNDAIELSLSICGEYIHHFLDKLPDSSFCNKKNFDFIAWYYQSKLTTRDRAFEWCLHHAPQVDSVMNNKGYSDRMVIYTLYYEEIIPALEISKKTGKSPSWNKISRSIAEKSGEKYVVETLIYGKLNWSAFEKDWEGYSKYLIEKVALDGNLDSSKKGFPDWKALNNAAWQIFVHSHDNKKLQKAVGWIDLALKAPLSPERRGTVLDTKANLAYKMGRKQEALLLEKNALELSSADEAIKVSYQKMLEGKPTW